MRSFTQLFLDARSVSTPMVAIRTFDPIGTLSTIKCVLGDDVSALTPMTTWDSIHGLQPQNEPAGAQAVTAMCAKAALQRGATVDLPIALAVLSQADEDVIAFILNPQLVWNNDTRNIQGIANLRDEYKANGNMLVLFIGYGDEIPVELEKDILVLEDPLPTRVELAKIVTDTFSYAAQNKLYAACEKTMKSPEFPQIVKDACDALIGLPAFPAEQQVSLCLNKVKGELDIKELWRRKKEIVSQNPGLSYHDGNESLADMYGYQPIKDFGTLFMKGPKAPTVLIRADEFEKQMAGNATDTSGTKGMLLNEWLTWVNDNGHVCTLFVGVPGSSKSFSAFCLGGEFNKPVINYSVPGMEHSHVGQSAKHMRTAHKTLDAISGSEKGKVWFIATANSLNGLPPEVISRFQRGGIYFFDAPSAEERVGIMKLKIKAYGLPDQELPNMENWTGRDIDNCAAKAEMLGCTLVEAAKHIIPLLTSHREKMEELRESAHNRYLSANKPGLYQYESAPIVHAPLAKITEGRKMR